MASVSVVWESQAVLYQRHSFIQCQAEPSSLKNPCVLHSSQLWPEHPIIRGCYKLKQKTPSKWNRRELKIPPSVSETGSIRGQTVWSMWFPRVIPKMWFPILEGILNTVNHQSQIQPIHQPHSMKALHWDRMATSVLVTYSADSIYLFIWCAIRGAFMYT